MTMTKAKLRWSQLMSNLEEVVHAAHDMKRAGEMTEEQYQHFNNTVGNLEMRARDLQ